MVSCGVYRFCSRRCHPARHFKIGFNHHGCNALQHEKEDAAEFSFLLSIPAILGGAVLEIPGAVSAGAANINWLSVVLGVAAAAVSGYFAVRFMIKLITKHSLWGFAIYTAILGAFIVLDQNILHLIAW